MHAPRHPLASTLLLLACLALPAASALAQPASPDTAKAGSRFFSNEDGMLDISEFMQGRYGFLPIPFPITEPAVGYGAGAVLTFVSKPRPAAGAGFGRPNISLVGGLATENGSWMLMAADIRFWRADRVKSLVAAASGSLKLDYGGSGAETGGQRRLLGYDLDPDFVTLQLLSRVGRTRLWAGLRYAYATSLVTFETADAAVPQPERRHRSQVGSLAPSLVFDSRDNNFTPLAGTYAEAYVGGYRSWLGSDEEFESVELTGIHYVPLGSKLFFGMRADVKSMDGSAPFYVLPYVEMRGVPALRYQGERLLQGEVEMRWQCLGRWSLVGFTGLGSATPEGEPVGGSRNVWAGGAGVRYELARAFGIHTGMDVAWGPDGAAIYFQTGSAWGRP